MNHPDTRGIDSDSPSSPGRQGVVLGLATVHEEVGSTIQRLAFHVINQAGQWETYSLLMG